MAMQLADVNRRDVLSNWSGYCCTIALLLSLSVSGQQCSPNMGLEYGNFTGWSGNTGTCNTVNCMTFVPTPGIVLPGATIGRHAITSGGIDPNTCNQISQLCPTGGQYSMRLGNWDINWETEDIMYTYRVDPANPILLYSYVPILEDPNHPDTIQPAFKTYIKDYTGAMVPCSYYRVTATNMRAYSTCFTWRGTQVRYTNWREVAIDMSAYAGQSMTLYFHTNDCGWGAHFGYAYIDVIRCYPKSIQLPPCGTPLPWIITAPPGFASYQWSTGQSGQTITITQPVLNLTCQVTSFQGCQIVLNAATNNITPTLSAISHN